MAASFVLLTGASGSGKTTLAEYFSKHYAAACHVFFFDSIGVPPVEKMEAEYGSGEAWQRAMTVQWIEHIHPLLSGQRPVLFEGQMRLAFIKEALAARRIEAAHIILIDCDNAIRTTRLQVNRSQPELANSVMMNWASFLRDEAIQFEAEILDTGQTSFDDCVSYLKLALFN